MLNVVSNRLFSSAARLGPLRGSASVKSSQNPLSSPRTVSSHISCNSIKSSLSWSLPMWQPINGSKFVVSPLRQSSITYASYAKRTFLVTYMILQAFYLHWSKLGLLLGPEKFSKNYPARYQASALRNLRSDPDYAFLQVLKKTRWQKIFRNK